VQKQVYLYFAGREYPKYEWTESRALR